LLAFPEAGPLAAAAGGNFISANGNSLTKKPGGQIFLA